MDTLAITAKELAEILGKSVQAIHKASVMGKWNFIEEKGRGRAGKLRKFTISFLPEDIKIAIASFQQKQLAYHTNGGQALVPVAHPSTYTPALPDPGSRGLPNGWQVNLPSGARLDKGMAKADLLHWKIATRREGACAQGVYAGLQYRSRVFGDF
jgi:hypothetical protein